MMELTLGLQSLRKNLAELKPEDQVLAIDLRKPKSGRSVYRGPPTRRARLFLLYLDAKFGDARFDEFLRGYFEHFSFKSITTEEFLKYLQDNLLDRFPGTVSRDEVKAWVYGPGIPPGRGTSPPRTPLPSWMPHADAWLDGKNAGKRKSTPMSGWAQQWLQFLNHMPATLTTSQNGGSRSGLRLSRTRPMRRSSIAGCCW